MVRDSMKTFFKNINTDNDKNILKQYIDNQKIPFSICIGDLSSGDWKAEIKRQAHFYQANTGITSLPQKLKSKMWHILQKYFNDIELKILIDCFNEMKLKSCRNADTKEMITLITEAHILILNVLNKNNNIIDILQIEGSFHSLLMKWYNSYINSEYYMNSQKDEELRSMYEDLQLII